MPRQRGSRKADGGKSHTPAGPDPIFGEGVPDVIPGEVILQLASDASAQITESIPTGPSRGHSVPGPRGFGTAALDRVLADLKTTSISRLTPPVSTMTTADESVVALASTFRVRFDSATSVQTAVERLARVDGVEYAEPNRYRETWAVPNDPSFASQWGLAKINCPGAWDRTTGSQNVVVAVIDTGIDLDHPELAPLLVAGWDMVDLGPNPTPPPGFRFEGDFVGRDNDPQDEVGHGTHVAGTIACLSNNGVGVAGVTWSCRLMPVKVLTRIVNNANANDVRGTGSAADIAAGIRWAVDHGARVLNLSLGGTTDTRVERDAIAYAISQGAVVVAAMGNAFAQGNPTSYPAAYPDVIAVGAINSADQKTGFSQTGPHIDVAAPGLGILSTVWNNGYASMNGTSMASPHVAGVAALILSCNANLSAAQVGDIIRQTARPLRDNPADPVPNNTYGFGCVDAKAAIDRACPPVPSRQIICRTRQIICRSVAVICPTQPAVCFSRTVSCASGVVLCRPSVAVPCQTVPAICRPSLAIRCPSGPVCGIERPPPGGGAGSFDDEEWAAHDPYAYWYGEEESDNPQ